LPPFDDAPFGSASFGSAQDEQDKQDKQTHADCHRQKEPFKL